MTQRVAEQGRVVVGVGQVKPHRDGSLELASMAVAPGHRGQGIGAALIEKLIARQPNAVLHLTCRRELVGYYEQFGFRRLVAAEYPPYFRRLIPLVNLVARVFATRIVVMRRDLAA